MRVNTNSPSDAFKARDRKGLDITLGESELLAIWTVSNNTEKNRTTKESIAAETVVARARAPSGEYRRNWKPSLRSKALNSGTERNAASVEKAGTTHSDDRRKPCTRFRKAHEMKAPWTGGPASSFTRPGRGATGWVLAAIRGDARRGDCEGDMLDL